MSIEYTLSEPRAKEERTNDILSIYFAYTLDIQPIYKQTYFVSLVVHIQRVTKWIFAGECHILQKYNKLRSRFYAVKLWLVRQTGSLAPSVIYYNSIII